MESESYADVAARARGLVDSGDFAEAVAVLRVLIQRIEAEVGTEAKELIEPLSSYAHALGRQHDWRLFPADERHARERALKIAIGVFGGSSAEVAGLRRTLASALHASGAHAEGAKLMQLVADHTERVYGVGPVLARTLKEVALIHLDLGEFERARDLYARCWAMTRGGRSDKMLDAVLQSGLARALLGLGRARDALPVAEAAYNEFVERYGEGNRHVSEFRELLERTRREAERLDE